MTIYIIRIFKLQNTPFVFESQDVFSFNPIVKLYNLIFTHLNFVFLKNNLISYT